MPIYTEANLVPLKTSNTPHNKGTLGLTLCFLAHRPGLLVTPSIRPPSPKKVSSGDAYPH